MVGSYWTKVAISDPSNYSTYTLTAKASVESSEISATKEIKYCTEAPVVQNFTMTYSGNTYDLTSLGTTKPTVTFDSGEKFNFNVEFTNPEQIESVYICSTRSNVTKRMEAKWDETTKSYVASGLFDPSNSSYVPGAISVQYSPVKEKLSFEEGIDLSSEKYVNGVSNPIKAMLNGKTKDFIEDLNADDNELSGFIKMVDADSILDFNIATDVLPSYLDPDNAGEYGYEVLEDDYGAKLYLKVAEYAEDQIRGEIIDFAHEEVVDFMIKGKHFNAATNVESYFSFVQVLGYADKLITWDNNRISLSEARQSVESSSMTPEEKAAALKKLDVASKSNNGVVAAMALQIILTAAGVAIPFPASMILPLLSMQNSNYVNDVLGQFGFLDASETDGALFNFRWKIDPSGYVYDANTNERLPGVTTTVYCVLSDGSDGFFANKPSDTNYGTLWDASEWDQMNPLTTDSQGRYAWDVPEGWWRVKYEKEGYHTVWSDWMPVPPPQTEVNIGMTSIASPTIETEYTVTWIVNGMSTSQKYKQNASIIKPVDPTQEGYIFKGWTPSVPSTMPAYDLTFTAVFEKLPDCTIIIKKPSTTSISYKSGIILHADITNLPDGAYVEWTSSNNNFAIKEKSSDGSSLTIISAANGDTIFTATVVDSNGNPILDVNGNPIKAEQKMTSKASFFDKIIAFFKGLFGLNKIIPQAFKGIF